jgi:hypothetical protein
MFRWDHRVMRIPLLAFLTTVLLLGCRAEPMLRGASDLTRDLRQKDVRFVLNQDVSVPAGQARLFLQDGAIVGGRSFYRPHCNLEIDSVSHSGFPISAGSFEVTRVQRTTVQIASTELPRLAATTMVWGSLRSSSDRFFDGYHFWLVSETQPAVMRLTCYGIYERPGRLRPPTLQDIEIVLGQVGALRVDDA